MKNSTELKIKALRLKSGVGRKETMLKINELTSPKHLANETALEQKCSKHSCIKSTKR